jgi:GxxExxY protein
MGRIDLFGARFRSQLFGGVNIDEDGNYRLMRHQLVEEALTHSVIGAFYEVYNTLGFGFLEHIYVMALERELIARGHTVGREVGIRVQYKGDELGLQRIDMLVDEKLIVEVKSTYELHKAAPRQVFNYLRATNLEVGLLLFFGPKPSFFRLISSNKQSAAPVPSAASGRPFVIDAAMSARSSCS